MKRNEFRQSVSVKISATMPVYNAESFLEQTLDSLLRQTLREFELICVNDGSTDQSLAILEAYAARDSRIKVLSQENKGPGAARNLGLEYSQAPYFICLDSDEIYEADMFRQLYEAIQTEDADIAVCRADQFDWEQRWPMDFSIDHDYLPKKKVFSPEEAPYIFRGFIWWSWDKLIRRDLLERYQLRFDEFRTSDDLYCMLCAVLKARRIVKLESVLVHHRINVSTSVSESRDKKDNWKDILQALAHVQSFMQAQGIYERYEQGFMNYCAHVLMWNLQTLSAHGRNRLRMALRSEWLDKLGFSMHEKEYFCYEKGAYSYLYSLVDSISYDPVVSDADTYGDGDEGMFVYGVGAHLADMLMWNAELAGQISRVFDKDPSKEGQATPGVGKPIESIKALQELQPGTQIAIAAIRYFDEIEQEIHALNPGLICLDIDEAWTRRKAKGLVPVRPSAPRAEKKIQKQNQPKAKPPKVSTISEQQLQLARGRDSLSRWRQRMLLASGSCRHILWGTQGARAAHLRRQFAPIMKSGDFFIEEDPAMRGKSVDGLPVCLPEVLSHIGERFLIIVLTEDYWRVRERLLSYGYVENVDFVEGRQLLGEDEHGFIDVPHLNKAESGMLVYGYGDHLRDMLQWHPKMKFHISRIIDKDLLKHGQIIPDVNLAIESPKILQDLPAGTEIVVAAIRYYDEICEYIKVINPGIVCRNIDEVWDEYISN